MHLVQRRDNSKESRSKNQEPRSGILGIRNLQMKIKLKDISTSPTKDWDKKEYQKKCEDLEKEIDEMQEMLFAESKKSLLIIFQGLDASGKDGATKKVLGRLNPQGVKVKSFKKPTSEELAHDFLWRVHQHTPEKGMIQIFNRSHYEDVLVTRVLGFTSDEVAEKRFELINSFESLLEQSGTRIIKFYLHISHDKQKEKFLDRLRDPNKYWKYNPEDWNTRASWEKYIEYYEEVLEKCNDPEWEIIPADENWYKEYLIAKKIHQVLKEINPKYPPLPKEWESEKAKYLS